MKRLRYLVLSGALTAFVGWPLLAQNISVVSGNGQLLAPVCFVNGLQTKSFTVSEPMTVKVTDSFGNPVPGATVTWTVSSGTGALSATASVTDSTGQTSSRFTSSVTPVPPYVQSQILATTATGASAIFYLTQAATTIPASCSLSVQDTATSPTLGSTISGNAGGTGSPPITVSVTAGGLGVPNVSVRLINAADTAGTSLPPPASCATAAGADPGSVLTDANGNATCTPILQGAAGSGNVDVFVGGVAVATGNNGGQFQGGPIAYDSLGPFGVQILASTPGAITITGGNSQAVNPGQALPLALTAQVTAVGGGALSGQTVTWSVTPSGAATLSSTTTTSDANGMVSTNLTLSSSAVGTIQVKVALTSNPSISATFTETANVTVGAFQKVSGDNQTAALNAAFTQPLIVQVNGANNQPIANASVQFSISGPGTLSATTATTNASGQAQVSVTAGATAGAVTVTASVGGSSVAFTLTVTAAPSLTSANFLNGAGFYVTDSNHSALTPCGITAIIGPGLAPGIQGVVASPATFGVLPFLSYLVANVSVTVAGSQAPIYSVSNMNGQQQVNFQVPCSVTPSTSVPVVVTVSGASTTVNLTVRSAGPGIFDAVMSDGSRQAILIRPDGSMVDSQTNPVRPGEQVTMFVTGIGPTSPPVATNAVPAPGVAARATSQVIVGVNNAGVAVISSQLSPDIVGVAEVTFQVPAGTPTGTYALSMGINAPDGTPTQFSQSTKITVHQ